MKIIFDHQIYNNQKFGGISRYFYELSIGLKTLGHEVENTIRYSENVFTSDKEIYKHSKKFFYQYKGKGTFQTFFNKSHSIKRLRSNDYDVFHPTYYDKYFIDKGIINKPFVLTFYDLIHEKFSEEYPDYLTSVNSLVNNNKILLERASKIIAISESTKRDIIDYYKVDPDRIEVTYLASSLNRSNIPDTQISNVPYILFVGNRGGYKNFSIFIESIAELLRNDKSLCIICAGGGDFTTQEKELLKSINVEKQTIYKSITSDNALEKLYANALMFVFPSIYEGFGIPTLEAFNCGCPVILSNTSSMPEVAGDAALYINPKDSQSMYNAVKMLLADSELRNKYKYKGFEQAKKFNWHNTVNQTIQIYRSLL